jgi:hypothetical protein
VVRNGTLMMAGVPLIVGVHRCKNGNVHSHRDPESYDGKSGHRIVTSLRRGDARGPCGLELRGRGCQDMANESASVRSDLWFVDGRE